MAARRQESKKLIAELTALAEELGSARKPVTLRDARRAFERIYVQYVIAASGGDRSAAAERLDIGFSTLKEKIRRPGKWRWVRVD
ncbi:MAG TPA: helix-turn-helix domain-containing protein [Kofleriaceae bacterium]|nr:helix-turn-helix domain-containing protein [Kofleriaceae bacterium]